MEIMDSNVSPSISEALFNDERLQFIGDFRNLLSGYYANADSAHMLNHVDEVKQRAISMIIYLYEKYNIKVDTAMVLVAIELHDAGSCIDRENHAEASISLVNNENTIREFLINRFGFLPYDFVVLLNCIHEHSSHYDGEYYCREAEVVASADRDDPTDIYKILERSARYSQKYFPDNVIENTANYNIGRYANPYTSKDYRVPKWHYEYYEGINKDTWKNMQTFFSNKEAVTRVVEAIINEEGELSIRKYIDSIVNGSKSLYNEAASVRQMFTGR